MAACVLPEFQAQVSDDDDADFKWNQTQALGNLGQKCGKKWSELHSSQFQWQSNSNIMVQLRKVVKEGKNVGRPVVGGLWEKMVEAVGGVTWG